MITINLWLLPRHNAYTHEASSLGLVSVQKIPEKGKKIKLAYCNEEEKSELSREYVVRDVERRGENAADVYVY